MSDSDVPSNNSNVAPPTLKRKRTGAKNTGRKKLRVQDVQYYASCVHMAFGMDGEGIDDCLARICF
jgi:hypothetical protein